MTLPEYKFIFYMEWIHRIIARLAGFFYAIPVFYFLFKKKISLREFGVYFVMGMLFIGQAIMGCSPRLMSTSSSKNKTTLPKFKRDWQSISFIAFGHWTPNTTRNKQVILLA